jgi:hypothetical protein
MITRPTDDTEVLARAELMIAVLRGRHAYDGRQFDEQSAIRTLQYFCRMAEGHPDDDAEWKAAVEWISSQGQSLDWILSGDLRDMICRCAARSPQKPAD